MRLGGIALVAIGVSGLVAWGLGALVGHTFVAGDPPGVAYTAARCRDLFEYAPHARTCAQAATTHHFSEIVFYRIAAGVLGGAVIGATFVLRRRRAPAELEPETLVPTVATAVFAVAGIGLIGEGIDLLVLKPDGGAGGYLSGGVVALALAVWFAVPVVRSLAVRVSPARA